MQIQLKRDQRAVIAVLVILVVFCLVKWIIAPVFEKEKTLARIFVQKSQALAQMQTMAQTHARLSGSTASGRNKTLKGNKAFSLFAFMDAQAKKHGVKENVAYMRPFTRKGNGAANGFDMVDIQLASVYLSDLAGFISGIESSGHGVFIHSLSLTRREGGENGAMLDVLMETAVPVSEKNK